MASVLDKELHLCQNSSKDGSFPQLHWTDLAGKEGKESKALLPSLQDAAPSVELSMNLLLLAPPSSPRTSIFISMLPEKHQ